MTGRGTGMLRLSSIDELAESRARRERYNNGQTHALEKEVLKDSLEFLKRHPKMAWVARSNVGSGFLLRRPVYERLVREGHLKPDEARFARYGLKNGGDLTGQLIGGRRFEGECKSDTGVVHDEQQAFGDAVNGAGGLWIVIRSLDDIVRALE